ncbi:uncharacterized protein NECHADRAFT_79547 [Fusarium vanettenii 77-13-4]|uniref:Uncharacterized protein n=1 Tax=Fusarium vanettenii (strain ATCC MYA-4622 / CBS 123669 / FGSC 9596 / NRRL 45880 / 77-13-4) TaxID=660122 RepID=C7Z7T2_FUSV7|nr:uncharacterized protein NECHADRAFT_79547 [Fusarium vanettenii 77-13-4]EEU39743.1 predicted protein [Fusarium vanettenii 77-13-4]
MPRKKTGICYARQVRRAIIEAYLVSSGSGIPGRVMRVDEDGRYGQDLEAVIGHGSLFDLEGGCATHFPSPSHKADRGPIFVLARDGCRLWAFVTHPGSPGRSPFHSRNATQRNDTSRASFPETTNRGQDESHQKPKVDSLAMRAPLVSPRNIQQ